MPKPSKTYSVQFTNSQTPKDVLGLPDGIPAESIERVQMTLTQEQFDNLEVDGPITRYMYGEGKSDEEFPTTISAYDVIKRAPHSYTIHDAIIEGFLHRDGKPKPSQEELHENAIRLDDISPRAVEFMLFLHAQWMDPLGDPDISEILELAAEHDLTLEDFYNQT